MKLDMEYAWLFGVMKSYEIHYYQNCKAGQNPHKGNGYLAWLAKGRYAKLAPKIRTAAKRRRLLLLCP